MGDGVSHVTINVAKATTRKEETTTSKYEYNEVAKCASILLVRAMKEERALKEFPKQDYYYSGSDFFRCLERRNELLNEAIEILKEEGFQHPPLRIHQIDGKNALKKIGEFVIELQKREETAKSKIKRQLQ